MDYPQYRASLDGISFFEITSPTTLEEVRIDTDRRAVVREYKVETASDREVIYDLTFDYAAYAEVISLEHFHALRGMGGVPIKRFEQDVKIDFSVKKS